MDAETRERLDMLAKAKQLQVKWPEKAQRLRWTVLRRIRADMRADGTMKIMTPAQATQEVNARLAELEGQA